MSDNEYQHVDVRKVRQTAYRIVDLVQTESRQVQLASIMFLVSALADAEEDVISLLYESDNMLSHSKQVQPAETEALMQYVKQCILKDFKPQQ